MDFVCTIVLATVEGDVVIMGTPSAAVSALLGAAGDICCRYLCTSSCVVSVSILSTVTKGTLNGTLKCTLNSEKIKSIAKYVHCIAI